MLHEAVGELGLTPSARHVMMVLVQLLYAVAALLIFLRIIEAFKYWNNIGGLLLIIAEMFTGKPLLPGSSTIDQLERILDVCGKPSAEEVLAMDSKFAGQMIDTSCNKKQRPAASDAHRAAKAETRPAAGGQRREWVVRQRA